MDFISRDKKTINLPVPFGETVYRAYTSCNDSCLFQKAEFEKAFPSVEGGRCSPTMPCHTKLHSIKKEKLTLSNLEQVLKGWSFHYFASEMEARAVVEKRIAANIQKLLELDLTP